MFDLSIVPNGGIKTAILTLNVVAPPASTRTYSANLITSFWNEPDASWNIRAGTTAWGAAGGDYDGTVSANANVTNGSTRVNWTLTPAVQAWYNSSPNFGFLIRDTNEGGGVVTTQFSSKEAATPANRPSLTLTFLQNVTNLTATPGNGSVALNWAFPPLIGTIVGAESYAGVVIFRSNNGAPVTKGVSPADGSAPPALCTVNGNGVVVFVSASTAITSFTDNSSDPCGAPANGTMYYYKVFTRDTANFYSSNPAGLPAPRDGSSTYTAEAGAMPNPPGSTQTPLWMIATHSNNLAAPGIMPTAQIDIGSDTSQLFALDATTGQRLYPPVSLGGIITGRPPILDAADASIAKQVAYVAAQDNYVYAVDTANGQILWLVNPGNSTTNLFQGGAAVQMKKFSGAGFTLPNDLVAVGTRNGASITTNRIIGINGNTGAVVWTYTGSAGPTTALDIISSTPAVDYVNNAIWVTSHSNNGAAQPNLWKLNPVTGAVLFSGNIGASNIDSSPSLTQFADVLFVGTNGIGGGSPNGRLYAVNPVTGATLAFFDDGNNGPVRGFPFIVNTTSPFTVVYTTNTQIHAVSFNASTNTFTKLWTTTAAFGPCSGGSCTLSAPVVSSVYNRVYTGGSDGFLFELNLATGAVTKKVIVNNFYPAVVGDPALDEVNQRVYVSTTTNDQRAYGFTIPF